MKAAKEAKQLESRLAEQKDHTAAEKITAGVEELIIKRPSGPGGRRRRRRNKSGLNTENTEETKP